MTTANEIFSDLLSETPNKREFLIEIVKSGKQISKTPWTEKKLQEATDKVIDKLYDKYQNPPPVKIDKQKAFKLGKKAAPILINIYSEGIAELLKQIPYLGGMYRVNVKKLKTKLLEDQVFCDDLAIQLGSKMIEQMGDNSPMQLGVSLASNTWDCMEPNIDENENDELSRGD